MKTHNKFCCHQILLTIAAAVIAASASAADKQPFRIKGTYVEGCSCGIPCGCELVGAEKGCQGVGALAISSGKFKGTALSGAKIAYAVSPGQWIRLYVDSRKPEQREAALDFAKAYFADWGKLETAREAHIDQSGSAGNF